jgi:hypothetical protein
MSSSGLRCYLLAGGLVCLSLCASGCGGSSGSHVAQLSSTSTTTQNSRPSTGSGASTAGGSITSQTLSYARCMRSHGVPTFPDPDSSGLPKTQVVNARKDNPSRFDSANTACRHLLPSGGTGGGNGETPAQIAQDWTAFRTFARCMRSHGVSNWPDPTSRSTSDSRPAFNITAVGLDGNSRQLRTRAQQCASLLHLGGLPAAH